ncbi:Thioredoxin-related transmembrane protein 2 [Hypsibius exemplaris]|uniref:Thioredoxin-related transmembrane protein 2 n=1 Tax=Hypsibius exemplaris TaxID=2072580 RepID=A0A1W0X911_HYPEX|nr:Thioredoxin-related transmembrane protein 2 [Hypsibius exemplaris]
MSTMDAKVQQILSQLRVASSRFRLEAKKFAHPFYILNTLLAVSFVVLRLVPPLCSLLFKGSADGGACQFDMREHETLMFVGCVTVIKNRGAPSWLHYLKKFMTYCKMANVYLFYRQHPVFAVVYVAFCILQMVFFGEPIYSGPEKLEYFSGLQNMERTIAEDKRNVWLVCFYTNWSMKCIDMAPTFAELSGQYWLPNFRFGKIDVGRFGDVASKYHIGTGAWTKQLPTIILFKDGVEVARRPQADSRGVVAKYEYALPTLIQDFDLNNVYEQQKGRLGKKALQEAMAEPAEATPASNKKKD